MTTELLLQIHQDEKYEFFKLYDTLGDLQKRIWQAVVWWCKRYPNAHPRQSKIAEHVGCSRKHVNQTFKKFQEFGWLILISRGLKRAKILFVGESLVQLDLVNREYFRRVEVTSEVTHSYSRDRESTSGHAGEIEIPQYLRKLNISLDAKLKLSLVPEHIYQETLFQCKKRNSEGFIPNDATKYFVGTALKMAKDRRIAIDWVRYYSAIKKIRPSVA